MIAAAWLIEAALAAWLAWGWFRWGIINRDWTVPSLMSLVGFSCGAASLIVCVGSFGYARERGVWLGYDSPLIGWGARLFLAGIVFSLAGIWRQNPLRWQAVATSFAALVLWCAALIAY